MAAIVLTSLIVGLACVGGAVEHVDDNVPTEKTYVQKFTINPSAGWWCDDTYQGRVSRKCGKKHRISSVSDKYIVLEDVGNDHAIHYTLDLHSGLMSAAIAVFSLDYAPEGPQKLACKIAPLEDPQSERLPEK